MAWSLSSKLLSIFPLSQFFLHILGISLSHLNDNSSLYNLLKKVSKSSDNLCAPLDLGLSWIHRPSLSKSSSYSSGNDSPIATSLLLIQDFFHQIKIFNWCKPIRKSAWIYLKDGTRTYFVKVPLQDIVNHGIFGVFWLHCKFSPAKVGRTQYRNKRYIYLPSSFYVFLFYFSPANLHFPINPSMLEKQSY